LLAGAGALSEAETAIEKAIDVARRQNAKSWELRSAMSLARLRRQQRRRHCSLRFTPGSPKASTPPTSKTPRRCSTASADAASLMPHRCFLSSVPEGREKSKTLVGPMIDATVADIHF
jgi:hypothetical protein